MNGDFQFTYKGKDESKPGRVRRQIKRMCSSISVPLALEENVRSGEIDIDENVMQQKGLIKHLDSWLLTH